MSVSVKCFHNLFIILPLGVFLLTKVNTFLLLFFFAMDFQVLLLSKKIIAFNETSEKKSFKYILLLNVTQNKRLISQFIKF